MVKSALTAAAIKFDYHKIVHKMSENDSNNKFINERQQQSQKISSQHFAHGTKNNTFMYFLLSTVDHVLMHYLISCHISHHHPFSILPLFIYCLSHTHTVLMFFYIF